MAGGAPALARRWRVVVSTESLPAVFGLLSLARVHRVFGSDVVYAGQSAGSGTPSSRYGSPSRHLCGLLFGHARLFSQWWFILIDERAGVVRLWVVLAITLRNLVLVGVAVVLITQAFRYPERATHDIAL
jgi:hypothetical protein